MDCFDKEDLPVPLAPHNKALFALKLLEKFNVLFKSVFFDFQYLEEEKLNTINIFNWLN